MNIPSAKTSTATTETWQQAMEWVAGHHKLIGWIAAPYLPFMAADSHDLHQEATIAAFHALVAARKKNSPERFVAFFRVIFKTHCLRLANGVYAFHPENDLLCQASAQEEDPVSPDPLPGEIDAALRSVGGRQREVCAWILKQSRPVSTLQTARHFSISQRHACRLLHSTLKQLTEDTRCPNNTRPSPSTRKIPRSPGRCSSSSIARA
jgi:hypothetical protein